MRLILASVSPRRKELLKKAGFAFETFAPDTDEISEGLYFEKVALFNAIRKAEFVAGLFPDAMVIGADTVIESEGRILGKPCSLSNAADMLSSLSGKAHRVVSAVCVRNIEKSISCVFAELSTVYLRDFGADTIDRYLRLVNVLDKAGAYAVQEYGDMLVEKLDGSVENVIGLPTARLTESLNHLLSAVEHQVT
ncbi:MAG: septum formation protein Maf [Lentisphaerae bacterium GWF2_45_14]|nr:MAG: septum formation protein Maf [Lentisphaerae bacterium GWF2_45_14]